MFGDAEARQRSNTSDKISLKSNQSDDSSRVGMKKTVGLTGAVSFIVGVMIGRFLLFVVCTMGLLYTTKQMTTYKLI